MDTPRSEAGRDEDPRTLTLPDEESGAAAGEDARTAGIDAAILDRLLVAMEPGDRDEIRTLCARDIETARLGIRRALRRWDAPALARHLHVMVSLAQTVGAEALAAEVQRMQARLRSGATSGYLGSARRVDELSRRASRYLGDVAR